MNTSEQKLIAEILVEKGRCNTIVPAKDFTVIKEIDVYGCSIWRERVDPFADTLEGRRQADVIEDWLYNKSIWDTSTISTEKNTSNHQWRLDRIKWCINKLIS